MIEWSQTTDKAICSTVHQTKKVVYRGLLTNVPDIENFVKGSIDHCSHDGGSFIQGSNDHSSHHGGSFIKGSNDHCSHHGGILYRVVMTNVLNM